MNQRKINHIITQNKQPVFVLDLLHCYQKCTCSLYTPCLRKK